MCVWVCRKFDQPEILGKGLSEQVTIELTPKDPQKDYLKQRKQQVQKPEKGKIFPKEYYLTTKTNEDLTYATTRSVLKTLY